jgi:hypothetical protein
VFVLGLSDGLGGNGIIILIGINELHVSSVMWSLVMVVVSRRATNKCNDCETKGSHIKLIITLLL